MGNQVESWDFSSNHSSKCEPDVGRDDSLSFLSESWIACHLWKIAYNEPIKKGSVGNDQKTLST